MSAYVVPDGVPIQLYLPTLDTVEARRLVGRLMVRRAVLTLSESKSRADSPHHVVNFGLIRYARVTEEDDLSGITTIEFGGSSDDVEREIVSPDAG